MRLSAGQGARQKRQRSSGSVVVDVEVSDEPVGAFVLRVVPHVFKHQVKAFEALSSGSITFGPGVVATLCDSNGRSEEFVELLVDAHLADAQAEPPKEGVVVQPSPLPPDAELVDKVPPGVEELGEGVSRVGE